MNEGYSTCPICNLHWLVTPDHDCCMPRCGCFGDDYTKNNKHRPCVKCGVDHALLCLDITMGPNDVIVSTPAYDVISL